MDGRNGKLLFLFKLLFFHNKIKQSKNSNGALLMRDPTTRMYRSNFTKCIIESINIAQIMMFKRLPLLRRMQVKLQRKDMMYERYMYAESIVERYNRIRYT